MISEHLAHSTPLSVGFRTWLWRYTCCCLISMLCTGKRFFNQKETSCLPLLNAEFEPRVSGTESAADWMPADKLTELSRIKLKSSIWTQCQELAGGKHYLRIRNFAFPCNFLVFCTILFIFHYFLLIELLLQHVALFQSRVSYSRNLLNW